MPFFLMVPRVISLFKSVFSHHKNPIWSRKLSSKIFTCWHCSRYKKGVWQRAANIVPKIIRSDTALFRSTFLHHVLATNQLRQDKMPYWETSNGYHLHFSTESQEIRAFVQIITINVMAFPARIITIHVMVFSATSAASQPRSSRNIISLISHTPYHKSWCATCSARQKLARQPAGRLLSDWLKKRDWLGSRKRADRFTRPYPFLC